MKRIYLILIILISSICIFVSGVTIVSAQKGNEEIPLKNSITLSTENIHLGGTIEATVISTMTTIVENYTAVIDWGDGNVKEGIVIEGNGIVKRDHLYNEPGQISIVVIAVMPDSDPVSASASLYVMTAQETVVWLMDHVDTLVQEDGLPLAEGQSLLNHLDAALAALEEEEPETAVAALDAYPGEIAEYIDAGLVSKEDPSTIIVEDLINALISDPASPQK